MNHAGPRSARAFSLVEILVVVSIIAILLSLAGVGAMSWINSSKITATTGTLKSLKAAIEEFANEAPMANGRGIPRSTDGPDPNREWRLPPPDNRLGYERYFGALPPSPTARIDLNTPTVSPFNEDVSLHKTAISKQFSNMVYAYLQGSNLQGFAREGLRPDGGPAWQSPRQNPTGEDYASIECLILFLSQMSPRSKASIDKILKDSGTNKDRDRALLAGAGNYADLLEVVDAWDQPLRWSVWRVTDNLVRWELRSAGKDGKFDTRGAFAPAGETDDVVLQGP